MSNYSLADVAEAEARKFYHGNVMGAATNLHPISDLFPYSETWDVNSWDNTWCAAFVYWCCIMAGYKLPVRYEHEAVSCNFAGCGAWEQWAKLPEINCWVAKESDPEAGDIVLFDNVFENKEHDHIAIIIDVQGDFITTAEGNFNNVSAIVKRTYDNVRGYIRLDKSTSNS
ncbi:MAG: CHAP domain-containing protein [Defluviitaleaceae bacterium]|nr:CHAP domain-containing protein [Defluviitaleaceae bacterium]